MDDERWVWCCSKCGREGPELVVKEKYKSGNAGYREVTLDDL